MLELVLADRGHVVLGIAGHHAGVAARADIEIDGHRPFVFWVVFVEVAGGNGAAVLPVGGIQAGTIDAAVRVVTVRALHQTFRHPMVNGQGEQRLDIAMAFEA